MNKQHSRSGEWLAILILGSLGPLILLLVPVIGIFVAPLSCLLTTVLVVHSLRSGLQGRVVSAIACIGILLINFAAAYVACEVFMSFRNA